MTNIKLRIIEEDDREVFRNLFNLYQHDLSMIADFLFPTVDKRGFYDYETIEEYFSSSALSQGKLFMYLIIVDDNIAGFCLLTKAPYVIKAGCDYCINEFFIIGSYRRKGIAREACKVIFKQHPGRYCFEVIDNNDRAKSFWKKLIAEVGTDVVIEDEVVFENGEELKQVVMQFSLKTS